MFNTLEIFTKKQETLALLQNQGFNKSGDVLLSHRSSTIGAGGLNFSVRNGKRWCPAAIIT